MENLTKRQREALEDLTEEFSDCINDSWEVGKTRKVPYVRLPVREDYRRGSEAPFKKNPRMTSLTIDFVRDLERRGLVSRCTDNEATLFVYNSLLLPKGDERYRFVCTFSQLNKNMLKDPYGMRTLDVVFTALEGNSWFTTIDLVDGFFSLPLYPADRGFTAFWGFTNGTSYPRERPRARRFFSVLWMVVCGLPMENCHCVGG